MYPHETGKANKNVSEWNVWVGTNLSDMITITNGLKQGDALSPLVFNYVLEYTIRSVLVNQDGLKLNQLLVYANDVNTCILGGSIHTIKKNEEALLVASKNTGLEINADRTKYMFISWAQNARRSHSIKIYNSSFERAEDFKYLGRTLTGCTWIVKGRK